MSKTCTENIENYITTYNWQSTTHKTQSPVVNIKSGFFQKDSFKGPIWFCLALNFLQIIWIVQKNRIQTQHFFEVWIW